MPFDLTVHHRDPKSGVVVNVTPYKYVCDKEKGNYYIRNGIKYNLDGTVNKDHLPIDDKSIKR
jgi:hypothetical protein